MNKEARKRFSDFLKNHKLIEFDRDICTDNYEEISYNCKNCGLYCCIFISKKRIYYMYNNTFSKYKKIKITDAFIRYNQDNPQSGLNLKYSKEALKSCKQVIMEKACE